MHRKDCDACVQAAETRKDDQKRLNEFITKISDFHEGQVPFDFDSLHPLAYLRCIQLLSPVAYFCFMRTSKKNYRTCLQIRGLECTYLLVVKPGGMVLSSSDVWFVYHDVAEKWRPFLVSIGNLTMLIAPTPETKIIKTYIQLSFSNSHGYPDVVNGYLKQLVHPGLKGARIDITSSCNHSKSPRPFSAEQISTFFANFKICDLQSFCFSFQMFTRHGNTSLADWKPLIEEFYGQHKNMQRCIMWVDSYNEEIGKTFKIEDNVLKWNTKDGYVTDFDPATVLKDAK